MRLPCASISMHVPPISCVPLWMQILMVSFQSRQVRIAWNLAYQGVGFYNLSQHLFRSVLFRFQREGSYLLTLQSFHTFGWGMKQK